MKKTFFILAGLLFSGIGIVGALLPILPTFPFAVGALYFFSRSSGRFEKWLVNNRFLGPSIVRFKSGQGLSIGSKIFILVFTWISVGSSMIFFINTQWIRWILIGILVLQAWVIVRYKTYRGKNYTK